MFMTSITTSYILLAVLKITTAQDGQAPKSCKINDDIEGECILLQKCPRALELLKLNDIKSLRNLTCGYDKLDAKVCCITKKTDGISITFKNVTQDIATSRPEAGIAKNTVKVPPNPVPTYASATPQAIEIPTTKVHSTTPHTPKRNESLHKTQPESTLPPVLDERPSVGLQPPASIARPAVGAPPPLEALLPAFPSETVPTFNNPFATDSDTPAEEVPVQSDILPALPHKLDGVTEQMERYPTVQYAVNLLPGRNECGLLSTTDRIYGGRVAGLEELPWLARIKYLINSKEGYACHGSLITDRFVVTAAHCIVNHEIIEVRLGEWDAETDIDCIFEDCNDPPVDVKVDATYIHPSYNRRTLVGDIGILRLAVPVNFTEFVRPVCLPTSDYISRMDYDLDNEYLTGGWGKTEFEKISVIKRKIKLRAVPMETCRAAIKRISDQLAVSSICAGGRKDEDSCAGDSGSSLVKLASENRRLNWFLFGVTSFGSNQCGTEGLPGIYSRVTYYMDWILRVITS